MNAALDEDPRQLIEQAMFPGARQVARPFPFAQPELRHAISP